MLLNHCVMTVFSLKKRMNELINSSLRDGFVVFCWYRFVILSLRLTAIFPGESGLASLIGDNWSYKTCKAPVKSSPSTNQHPVFYRPDALPVAQPTASKHWTKWYVIVNNRDWLPCVATYTLTQPVRGSGRGSLVGYSAAGPPLYSFAGDTLQRTSQSVLALARSGLRQILDESDSRRIFYFLCINMVSSAVTVLCPPTSVFEYLKGKKVNVAVITRPRNCIWKMLKKCPKNV